MKFQVYKDGVGQYRWRLLAANSKTIADSGEGYYNRADCINGMALVVSTNSQTPVEDLTAAMAGRR